MNDTEEPEDREDEDLDILTRHISMLEEHFETVHIFCTRHKGNDYGTTVCNLGGGNFCARYGQVKDWIIRQEETSRDAVRGE